MNDETAVDGLPEQASAIANSKCEIEGIPDFGAMPLDLDKGEKVRAAALAMAIHYYNETIIKDAEYLKAIVQHEQDLERRGHPNAELFHLHPASVNGVINAAINFELFLLGRFTPTEKKEGRSVQTELLSESESEEQIESAEETGKAIEP